MQDPTKYKLNTILAVLLVVGVLLYVGMRVLLPAYTYFLKNADQYGVQIKKEQRGAGDYLAVTPFNDFPYHKVELTLKAKEEFGQIPGGFEVYKDFMAQSYPVGEAINSREDLERYLFFSNQTDMPNGTLIKNYDAVYFVSKGQLRPFLGPEVFVRLNFDWDRIIDGSGQFFAMMPEGEKLDFVSAHPDGSILKTKQGKLFLVWEGKRLPIQSEELLSEVWSEYYTVKVDSENPEPSGICSVKNQNPNVKTIRCALDPSSEFDSSTGRTYLFKLPESVFDTTIDAKVVFDVFGGFREYEMEVAKTSLIKIAEKLHKRYAGYLL